MIHGTGPKRPVILAVAFRNAHVVDARIAVVHQAVLIELPILVAVRAVPLVAVVSEFVSKADGDTIVGERPKLLDEPIV